MTKNKFKLLPLNEKRNIAINELYFNLFILITKVDNLQKILVLRF